MWQQWTNGVLGLLVVAVPFLGFSSDQSVWSFVILGLVIAVLGFWGATEHSTMHEQHGKMSHA